jgi:hypothetical protein
MDEARRRELEDHLARLKEEFLSFGQSEPTLTAEEAAEDRRALGRRIGRLYLAFAGVLIERLGEERGREAILEAMRDYGRECAEAGRQGLVDLPKRALHRRTEAAEVEGSRRVRTYGCGIAEEFKRQGREELGSLYCYIDALKFMMAVPNIKLYHTRMEPLGDDCCEFEMAIASDQEMRDVLEPGRDYTRVDPLIHQRAVKGRPDDG